MIVDPFELAAQRFTPTTSPHADDPVGWVADTLGEYVWSVQRTIMESVRDNRLTAVKACHGPGKSWSASRLVGWWMETHPIGKAKAMTSAPTGDQVKLILWHEINTMHSKGALRGYVNQREWLIGNQVMAMGRKPADYDEAAFQGLHSRYMFVVLDEAGGIPKVLWDAAGTLITNDDSRMLAIGNPDDPNSHFAEICKPGSGWNVIDISVFDTPNFTGEWIPEELKQMLVGHTWLEEKRREWGEDSPLWISKVLGQFPEDADDTVVPWSAVAKCLVPQEGSDIGTGYRIGLDVGGGGDKTVLTVRKGAKLISQEEHSTPDSTQVEGLALRLINELEAERIMVDVIGIGWGVYGTLKEQRKEGLHNASVIPVNVGSTEGVDTKKYANLRDQLWWQARARSLNGGWDLSEASGELQAQLIAPKYDIDSKGRGKVEPKKDTKKRLGRSPDNADSLLLAFYDGHGTGTMRTSGKTVAAARIG